MLARTVAAALLVLAGAAACSADDEGTEAPDPATTTSPPSTAPASPAPPTCADSTFHERSFILCTAGDAHDQGLVVALHGRGSSVQEMREGTGLDRAAAASGLAVVFPDGIDQGWGDDTFTTPARPSGDEDVVFLDELIAELRSDDRIDDDGPVGIVGFSNGASMALRYAAERPDQVRAVVSVAGQLPRDPAIRPTAPVSLLEVFGTADPVRGYDTGIPDRPDRQPGQPTPTLSTPDTIAAFVSAATADEHVGPEESDPDPTDATRLRTERWTAADGTTVVLHTIVGGGHTWPSSTSPPTAAADYGPTSTDLDATQAAVTFLLAANR